MHLLISFSVVGRFLMVISSARIRAYDLMMVGTTKSKNSMAMMSNNSKIFMVDILSME